MTIDFSIITVAYNSEKTIERTIKSVLNQSFQNYEYIIIDGNSNDKTNAIINQYKEKFKGGIIHISEPDKGIYDAMNKGIALAKGKVIGLLNSDDYYYHNTLDMVYDAFQKTDQRSVLTGELIFKSETTEQLLRTSKARFLQKTKHYKNGVRHPATFVPKVIYDDVGLFNLNYKIASDAELMYRIYKAQYEFVFINKPLLVMCDGGASNTKGLYKQLVHENRLFLKTYCPNIFSRLFYISSAKLRLATKEVMANLVSKYRKIENK
ncbi:glycosyltransferase family 2 protein [Winogradskyella forsetii]|uniref:glycosyltransferase family 2 protein n=1 Tax=Winogradskyella forsetii TaxID=2686077 RepID=UPI0015BE1E5A|nr:glycosyltransferase family 2 protein [Winogradskyella forsetii]